jgi:thiamine biosynthesis lipoprotein
MSDVASDDEAVSLRRFVFPALFVLALFVALWVRRPDGTETAQWSFDGSAFGTTYSVQVIPGENPGQRGAIEGIIEAQVALVNAQMSTYQDDSELSKLNANPSTAPIRVSPELQEVLLEARRIHALSKGAFDVTIGPLVNAWGFGPELVTPPSDEALAQARARVGMDKVQLDEQAHTVTRQTKDLYIDLSAIAKGYGVDQIGEALEGLGYPHYLVEIGGEVRARGLNRQAKAWVVGVEHPDGGAQDVAERLPLADVSIATSGNYRNARLIDGKTVTHILDARSGEPVSHGLGSVSVLHPSCMTADALATALYVLGPDEGLSLAEREGIAALFLVRTDPSKPTERTVTKAFHARASLLEGAP